MPNRYRFPNCPSNCRKLANRLKPVDYGNTAETTTRRQADRGLYSRCSRRQVSLMSLPKWLMMELQVPWEWRHPALLRNGSETGLSIRATPRQYLWEDPPFTTANLLHQNTYRSSLATKFNDNPPTDIVLYSTLFRSKCQTQTPASSVNGACPYCGC